MNKKKKEFKSMKKIVTNDEQSLQHQIQYLSKLDTEAFDQEFEKMMDEMNLSEVHRLPLRKREPVSKIDMLAQFNFKASKEKNLDANSNQHSNSSYGIHNVQDCIRELTKNDANQENVANTVQSIRVFLTVETLSVVQTFCKDGLSSLLNLMSTYTQQIQSTPTIQKILLESVRCMKAIMNNQMGLKSVLNSPTALILLARCIKSECPSMMLDAVRLMAAVFLVNHEKALNCLTVVAQEFNIPRFSNVLSGLEASSSQSLKASCLLLVNALVSSPQNLSLRVHLRNELCRHGFYRLHAELSKHTSEDIRTQLEIYDENKDDDELELHNRLRDVQIQFNDINDLFNLLNALTTQTSAAPYFLSILQHLVLIRDDISIRSAYFKLIEEVVSQIVLRKGGVDPDFMCSKLDVDIESLVDGLVNYKALEESKIKLEQYEIKLASEATLRSETEAKHSLLDAKNKKLEDEIQKQQNELNEFTKKIEQLNLKLTTHSYDFQQQTSSSSQVVSDALPPLPPPPPLGDLPPPPPFGGLPPPPPFGDLPPPPPFGDLPPPPPPFGIPGPPGPPPMGGFAPPQIKSIKKKYKPHSNMKRLNWTPMANNKYKPGTIWTELDEESMENADLFADIVNLFQQKVIAPKEIQPKDSNKKKVKENRVIDNKTAQNISIFLGSCKMTISEIRLKIYSLDPAINESFVESIIKFLPPSDQRKILTEYSAEYDDLTEAEQFLLTLNSIYRLETRIECLKFRLKFYDELNDIKPQIVTITTACREIKNNHKFKKVIALVLLFGNYMNAGSKNECAIGFDIKFLSKLADTKSNDNQLTFVNFLSMVIEDNYSDLCGFESEMLSVDTASKLNFENISKILDQLKSSLNKCMAELDFHRKTTDADDHFFGKMSEFVSGAEDKLMLVIEMRKTMLSAYEDLVNWFSLDLSKTPIDVLFKEIAKFLTDFSKARRDNLMKRERIEKEQRMKAAKEREKNDKDVKKSSNAVGDKEEGVIDELLQALETGQFRSKDAKDGSRKKKGASGNIAAELRKQRTRTLNKMASEINSELQFVDNL